MTHTEHTAQNGPLTELAKLFLWLGITGFGGPAVHIAMMEKEVVQKRRWMTTEHFLDLVGATNLIPGPNSTELTMHIGHERAGWKGLVVAGACFIFPAVIITAFFAYFYQVYSNLPQVEPFLYGIKPAIIAVITSLMINLGRKALKSLTIGIIGLLAAIAVLYGLNEIYVLFGAGIAGVILYRLTLPRQMNGFLPITLLAVSVQFSNLKILLTFLKIGSILYGSGYVLFAFLDAELVAKGLLSKQQLVDAIAVGQFTPGPVFSSATFIGWQMAGFSGAIVATLGIFLPSFLFVAALNPMIARMRRSASFGAFLDTVNMASIAVILSVVIEISRVTLLDWRSILIAMGSFIITYSFPKLNTAFIILGGAMLGWILTCI